MKKKGRIANVSTYRKMKAKSLIITLAVIVMLASAGFATIASK